jgi:hypothetical protein
LKGENNEKAMFDSKRDFTFGCHLHAVVQASC